MSFNIQQGLFKYNIKDSYAILGVPIDADEQKIRKQYLKIARQLHPDTCKFKTESERTLANQIFSQLVSPANKQISSEALRVEYLLVMTQIVQRIAGDSNAVTIASETSKTLFQATPANLNAEYNKIITTLSESQYKTIEEAINRIAEISEINLVYAIQKQGQNTSWKPKPPTSAKNDTLTPETVPLTPTAAYLKRAEQYIEKNLYPQAMVELRDVLKLNPNEASAHALMGLAYLGVNQTTMAKVHINKAVQSNPNDSLSIKAKKALDKVTKETEVVKNGDGKNSSKSTGIFKNIFGGKKD